MASDYGKKFEIKFLEDFSKLENSFVLRLNDQVTYFKNVSRNISDYVCYKYPYMFCIECKSRKGNTFNFNELKQLEKMQETIGINGLLCGVVIWFRNHHKVCFCEIEDILKLIKNGYKSINVKMIDDGKSGVHLIPGKMKRLFLDSDYNKLIELAKIKFEDIKNEI